MIAKKGIYNCILIDGTQIYRPNGFSPERQDIYAAEITTCTGKTIADRVGWKYSDMTWEWDGIPQEQVDALLAMKGAVSLQFDDADGETHTETIIPISKVTTATRITIGGKPHWNNVKVAVRFLDSHTEDE